MEGVRNVIFIMTSVHHFLTQMRRVMTLYSSKFTYSANGSVYRLHYSVWTQ